MLTALQKQLLELNYLGSYICEDDAFKAFDSAYYQRILSDQHTFETTNKIDFKELKKRLEEIILPIANTGKPVVFLSGGIDSTVLAHTLFDNGVSFDSYAFFMSEDDPGIKYIKYLDDKYGTSTKLIFGNYEVLRAQYNKYFNNYISPNIDYAFLSMSFLVDKIVNSHPNTGELVFFDGIEGDNLFGYKNTHMLKIKSILMHCMSGNLTNKISFSSKKLNNYTGTLIRDYRYNSLYQNYILTKALRGRFLKQASDTLMNKIVSPKSSKHLSFHSHNMLGMLYYMGRRVAYKNYLPIINSGNKVVYPFTEYPLLNFGFSLKNEVKITPVIKYPLKKYLEMEGYSQDFVYSEKRGMGFDLFKVISFDEIKGAVSTLREILPFKGNAENHFYSLFKQRDKAIDHYLFALAISAKYVQERHT